MADKWTGEVYVGRTDHTWYTLEMTSDLLGESDAEQDMINQAFAILNKTKVNDVAFVGAYRIQLHE